MMAVVTEVRSEKAEKQLPLNTQVKRLTIYAGEKDMAQMIVKGREDISGTCKIANIKVIPEKGEGREIKPYSSVQFLSEY